MRPLPRKLTAAHVGTAVRIAEDCRGQLLRRCYSVQHGGYLAAGGKVVVGKDAETMFYGPGVIDSLGETGRALVSWPEVDAALWLSPEELERA
jgi:hypothetical protein